MSNDIRATLLDITATNGSLPREGIRESLLNLDQKNDKGHFYYRTPENLSAEMAKKYEETMNKLFGQYSAVLRELIGFIRKSSEKPESMSNADWKSHTAMSASSIAAALMPLSGLVKVDAEISRQPVNKELNHLAEKLVPQELSPASEMCTLLSFTPRNEFDVIEPMLFELGSLPASSLTEIEEDISIGDRIALLRSYIGSGRTTALRGVRYEWELIEPIFVIHELHALDAGFEITIQEFTPRHGYDMPKIIEQAGLTSHFEKAFDMSYQLYSQLQSAGFIRQASLAVLMGHRVRWRLNQQLPLLAKMITDPSPHTSPDLRKLAIKMQGKWEEAHPTLADVMTQTRPR